MFNILIKNALIIDGTGSEGFYGSVGVSGDSIHILRGSNNEIQANRIIDATNMVVCPGFIDLHSHAGLTILGEPNHDPKVRQGVTTELIGIDGISHAPFKTVDELNRYIWLDSGLNGYPPIPADWLTVADQLTKYDNKVAVNMAIILGNSPVRIWSVGWDDIPATEKQIHNMQAVVREAMEEGAWGISTGLDYPPGAYASTDELIAISKTANELGGFYHTHTRASLKNNGTLAPWEEAIEIGKKSGIPIHLTHYRQSFVGDGSHLDYLDLVDNNRNEGMDVTFDCYTYPYSGTSLTIQLPLWSKSGGPKDTMNRLNDSTIKEKIKKEIQSQSDAPFKWDDLWLTAFTKSFNKKYEGMSLSEISNLKQKDPVDVMIELLIEENLGISQVGTGTNAHTLPAFVSHPYGMIASDAILFGDYPNPRTYGCFPIVLAEFVRAEKHLRLPEAIRKMTSFPAQRLGLKDRGILRDDMKADIVIFDPKTVKTHASRLNPKQFPIGIDYVIVNGELVIDNGTNTLALPGKSLRRGRD
ncbi:MAG: N-acyl-D-amino-acid deacylase [Chloroflexi bacterium]|jgi:N-acyl-D-amino-acid deacylase|nr:MAG: N-acyl-D-amino-acid deacylase [Chloroflexota bacterium]